MYFSKYFLAISDVLQIKFSSIERPNQNPTDKGDLCELFIQEAISQILENLTDSFRGGKIINIENAESKQIDIVLTSKNSLKVFSNKGVFPVESVKCAISVTATLSFPKLKSILDEFASIPKEDQRFYYANADIPAHTKVVQERLPYKVAFGFSGDLNIDWETYLNNLVAADPKTKERLPDLIVVNHKGHIEKVYDTNIPDIDGRIIGKDFMFTDYALYKNYGSFLVSLLHEVEKLCSWDNMVRPKYTDYFNVEIEREKKHFRSK